MECAELILMIVALIWSDEREKRVSGWTHASSSRAGSVICRFLNSGASYSVID